MPDEMLSFLAGGSTTGLVKPVAYDTIEAPMIKNSEIRKIAHDVQTALPTSERMAQRSSMGSWMLPWFGWSWAGSCGKIHAELGSSERESARYRLCT